MSLCLHLVSDHPEQLGKMASGDYEGQKIEWGQGASSTPQHLRETQAHPGSPDNPHFILHFLSPPHPKP